MHLCRNDGRPHGLVYTKELDLVVMNGGASDLPTEESFAQAVAEVGEVVEVALAQRLRVGHLRVRLLDRLQHLGRAVQDPDRQAAQMAVVRLDCKYALRQELSWAGFHYSDLCNFRKRLLGHHKENEVF